MYYYCISLPLRFLMVPGEVLPRHSCCIGVEKFRQYHDLVLVADLLSKILQHTMLQNAVVLGVNELRAVQIQSDLQKTTHGTTLMFAQIRTLLINVATGYDKRSDTANSSKGKPRRLVFSSEVSFGNQTGLSYDAVYDD